MRIRFDEAVPATGQAHYASVPIAPASVLTIPDIAKTIPCRFTDTCQPLYREFGKRLLEIGYLEDSSGKTLPTIIYEGWSRYVADLSDKQFSHIHFQVSVGEGDSYAWGDGMDDGQLGLHFWCDLSEAPALSVKKRLETLRRRNPPLAWLVLSTLESASTFLPIMTPDWFMQLVSQSQWMGEADETAILEEYLAEGVDVDDVDVLTRESVFMVLPFWANRACHANSDGVRRRISRWPLNDTDAHLLFHLNHLQDLLHGLEAENDFLDNHRSIPGNTFASMLFFDDGDVGGLFYRVVDDFYRQNSEGDSATYLMRIAFDPADSRQTQQTLRIMRAIFRMAEHLEDVLTIIGDKI